MSVKNISLAVAAVVALGGGAPVLAESPHSLTANIGAVSNYVWRGVTQNADKAAIQGGIDYAHASGFYAGTWLSSLDGGSEMDFYAGFGGEMGDVSYDLNTTYYSYPQADDANFWELGGSVGFKMVTVGLAYTLDGQADKGNAFREGDLYYYGSVSFDLMDGFSVGGTIGHYDFDDLDSSTGDYTHYQLSVAKDVGEFGEFTLNYDQADGDTLPGKPLFWVGWSKEF